ncbi:MAG: Gfo/Idh/MocA family oxidoreductase [Eubacteriales bacterium]
MSIFNFGVIGPGRIAYKFADACERVEGVTIGAVASTNLERATSFANQYGIGQTYGSYEELVNNESIDGVYIAVINTGHMKVIELAAKAGKAILCEKPSVVTIEEWNQVEKLVKENNVLFLEAVWTLFLPSVGKAKEWLLEGRIGQPRWLETTASYQADSYEDRVYQDGIGGGALVDVGVYCIALSGYLANHNPIEVEVMETIGVNEVDEYGTILLRYPNGIMSSGHYGICVGRAQDTNIWGQEGKIEIKKEKDFQKVHLYNKAGEIVDTFDGSYENGFVYQIMHFCELYHAGKRESDVISLANSRKYVQIYEDIRKKRVIE